MILAETGLTEAAAQLTGRAIDLGEIAEAPEGVRLLPVTDPDGNTPTLRREASARMNSAPGDAALAEGGPLTVVTRPF